MSFATRDPNEKPNLAAPETKGQPLAGEATGGRTWEAQGDAQGDAVPDPTPAAEAPSAPAPSGSTHPDEITEAVPGFCNIHVRRDVKGYQVWATATAQAGHKLRSMLVTVDGQTLANRELNSNSYTLEPQRFIDPPNPRAVFRVVSEDDGGNTYTDEHQL